MKFTTNRAALTGRTLLESNISSTRCSKTRALTARRALCRFDNKVRGGIAAARELLDGDKADEFIAAWHEIYENLLDLLAREGAALYPTSLRLISEDEFRSMRCGDDEIGYFLIEKPSEFYPLNSGVNGAAANANLNESNLSDQNVGSADASRHGSGDFGVNFSAATNAANEQNLRGNAQNTYANLTAGSHDFSATSGSNLNSAVKFASSPQAQNGANLTAHLQPSAKNSANLTSEQN